MYFTEVHDVFVFQKLKLSPSCETTPVLAASPFLRENSRLPTFEKKFETQPRLVKGRPFKRGGLQI